MLVILSVSHYTFIYRQYVHLHLNIYIKPFNLSCLMSKVLKHYVKVYIKTLYFSLTIRSVPVPLIRTITLSQCSCLLSHKASVTFYKSTESLPRLFF